MIELQNPCLDWGVSEEEGKELNSECLWLTKHGARCFAYITPVILVIYIHIIRITILRGNDYYS
jgi:hypothetical protein